MVRLRGKFLLHDVGRAVDLAHGIENMHRKPDAIEAKFRMRRPNRYLMFVEKHLDE